MLVGTFTFHGHELELQGTHIDSYFSFQANAFKLKNREFFDSGAVDAEGVVTAPSWQNLYVGVGLSNCAVEFAGYKGETPGVNREAFAYLGDIVQGMLRGCTTTRREDYLDIRMEGSFDGMSDVKYIIEGYGSVTMNMGTVRAIEFSDDIASLSLQDDGEILEPFYKPKRDVKVGVHPGRVVSLSEDNRVRQPATDSMFYSLQEIFANNPEKNYSWIADQTFIMVTRDTYKDLCKMLMNHDGEITFDTETTGLAMNWTSFYGGGDKLVGMVISVERGTSYYVPLRHTRFDNICDEVDISRVLEMYFKPVLELKPLICHNAPFDWRAMHTEHMDINIVGDTLALYKLTLWNDNRNMRLALKSLTKTMTGRDSLELSDFVEGDWGKNFGNFAHMSADSTLAYACPDTDNLWLLKAIAEENKYLDLYGARKTYETEVLFSLAIAYQEFYGHCVNVEEIPEINERLDANMLKYKTEMEEMAKRSFNPNSGAQLAEIMYSVLAYPVLKETNSGAPATDKKTLARLEAATNTNDEHIYPFAALLLRYRESANLKKGILGKIDEIATKEGLMFSEVQQFLETGRVSVKGPNYQSYDDNVKRSIIPRTDFYMLDFDYSSVEYRILASMAGQQNLVESFYDPDTDYHALQASRMYSIPYELVTKEQRSQSKGINFGIPYGMGNQSLGAHIFGEVTDTNTRKAGVLRKKYFEGQDKIESYFTNAQSEGLKNKWATTFFSRRRYFDPNKVADHAIKRQSGNHGIQGTAADIYKMAMGRLFLEIRKQKWIGKFLLSAFVHDECVIEVHKSLDPMKIMKVVREMAMLKIPGWCPLYIGVGFGESWYEAKSTEIPILLQEELEAKYGESGLDWWDGNTKQLTAWVRNEINLHSIQRVTEYIKNPESSGKVVNPVMNALSRDVMKGIEKGNIGEDQGVVETAVKGKLDTIENLREFSIAFGIVEDFDKRGFIVPEVVESSISLDIPVNSWEAPEEEPETPEEKMQKIYNATISMGSRFDRESGSIYISDRGTNEVVSCIVGIMQGEKGDYPVLVFQHSEDGEVTLTETSLKTGLKAVQKVTQLWMSVRA